MTTPAQLRSRVAGLVSLAKGDLATLWRRMERAADAEEALRDVLPAVIETYGAAAAVVAADWYDDLRDKRGIGGRFSAFPAAVPNPGAQELVGWALTTAKDPESFKSLIEGGLQRRIANVPRLTIADSSLADPAADGWQRVGAGSCAFCAMLIGRGAVYSEASADFASHDNCNCSAAPAFSGEPRPVTPYSPGPRHGNEADYARARAWIASH